MRSRIISGVVMVSFFATVVLFNDSFPVALNIAIAIVSAMCVFELINASHLLRHWALVYPSLIVSCVLPFLGVEHHENFVIYAAYSLCIFLALIIYHKTVSFKDLAIIYSMSIMIPTALQTIVYTRDLSVEHGMFYAMLAILAAWAPDVGAYFAGTFFGKHKLCPEISPKKTVEGFIGGIVFSVFAMIVIGYIFTFMYYQGERQVNFVVMIIAGIGGALISAAGDLSFSVIKRSCGVKDFGHVIPGHGGFLDRFDSVIFTAPFIYILVSRFPLVLN